MSTWDGQTCTDSGVGVAEAEGSSGRPCKTECRRIGRLPRRGAEDNDHQTVAAVCTGLSMQEEPDTGQVDRHWAGCRRRDCGCWHPRWRADTDTLHRGCKTEESSGGDSTLPRSWLCWRQWRNGPDGMSVA